MRCLQTYLQRIVHPGFGQVFDDDLAGVRLEYDLFASLSFTVNKLLIVLNPLDLELGGGISGILHSKAHEVQGVSLGHIR